MKKEEEHVEIDNSGIAVKKNETPLGYINVIF